MNRILREPLHASHDTYMYMSPYGENGLGHSTISGPFKATLLTSTLRAIRPTVRTYNIYYTHHTGPGYVGVRREDRSASGAPL